MSLVPGLSVAENIFLGRLPKKFNAIDWKKTYQMADILLHKMKVNIDPHETVYRLSMWQMQVVEFTKALSFNPKVIMLDEPHPLWHKTKYKVCLKPCAHCAIRGCDYLCNPQTAGITPDRRYSFRLKGWPINGHGQDERSEA